MRTVREAVYLATSSGSDSNVASVKDWLQEGTIGERPSDHEDRES